MSAVIWVGTPQSLVWSIVNRHMGKKQATTTPQAMMEDALLQTDMFFVLFLFGHRTLSMLSG